MNYIHEKRLLPDKKKGLELRISTEINDLGDLILYNNIIYIILMKGS